MQGSELKQQAWNRFVAKGLPHRKDEDWTYTNIKKILAPLESALSESPQKEPARERGSLCEWDGDLLKIVFVDGLLAATEADLAELGAHGLVLKPLNQLSVQLTDPEIWGEETFFEPFCLSQMQEGVWIQVQSSQIVRKIEILHRSSGVSQSRFPLIFLDISKGAETICTEVFEGFLDEAVSYQLPLTYVFLDEGSKVQYNCLSMPAISEMQVGKTRVVQKALSEFRGFSFLLGGKLNRHTFEIRLASPRTFTKLRGAFMGKGQDHVDQCVVLHHQQEAQVSDQLFKGILSGNARGVFQGKVIVTENAQKTNASQLSKVLLLSGEAEADTKPQLEILADDVKCSHGSAIGQMNPNEIFYLQSRGISKSNAQRMLSEAFVEELWSAEELAPELRERVSTLSRGFLS